MVSKTEGLTSWQLWEWFEKVVSVSSKRNPTSYCLHKPVQFIYFRGMNWPTSPSYSSHFRMLVLETEIAEGCSPRLVTCLFNYNSGVPQEWPRAVTAGQGHLWRGGESNAAVFLFGQWCYFPTHSLLYPQCLPTCCVWLLSPQTLGRVAGFVFQLKRRKCLASFFVQIIQYKKEDLLGKSECSWLYLLTIPSTSWKPTCPNCILAT